MTAATPGQAAYEAFCRVFQNESWGPWERLLPEPMIPEDDPRAGWEQIAQAAIDAATEGALRACGYTLADVGRFLEAEAAAQQPPGLDRPADALRRSMEARIALWRHEAEPDGLGDDDDPLTRDAIRICANELATDLATWQEQARDFAAQQPQPAPGGSHIGRSWSGHGIEEDCPCPKAPCGLVVQETVAETCDQHPLSARRTIRQSHRADECPATQPQPAPELADPRPASMLQPVSFCDDDPGSLRLMVPAADRDNLRALLDHETRLTWQAGLPGEQARIATVREQAGLEAL